MVSPPRPVALLGLPFGAFAQAQIYGKHMVWNLLDQTVDVWDWTLGCRIWVCILI